jgi:hypothetical protein
MENIMQNWKKRLTLRPTKIAAVLCLMAFFTGLYIFTNTPTFSKWCYNYLWLDKESRKILKESDRITFNNVHTRLSPTEYTLLINGDFEILDNIKNIKNASELKPFLDSEDTLTYSSAIRRLGEIQGPKAINTLKGYLTKGTTSFEVAFKPAKKLEAIRTLGRIGTERAKSILLDNLKLYWEKGPTLWESRNGNKVYYDSDDKDFTYTVPELLKALYKWSSDNDVYKLAQTIAESDDVEKYYGTIGIKAWEIYIKGEMLKKGISKDKDEIISLLELQSVEKNSQKYMAIRAIMNEKISETAMTSVIDEYKKEQDKEPRDNGLTKHYLELRNKIESLQAYLKNRQEAQAKLEAYKNQVGEIHFTPID